MAKENTLNYDEIRVGNTLMIEARRRAKKELKKYDEDEQQFHVDRIVNEIYERLVKQHNADAVSQIPLSGVQVTEENKNVIVTRFTLKDGVSKDDASAVLEEHEKYRTSMHDNLNLQSDMTDADFDDILKKAFDIHDVTMEEAASNRILKRFAADCLIDEPVVECSSSSPKIENSSPFEAVYPPISGEALADRLDQLGLDLDDLAIMVNSSVDDIGPWVDYGVPEERRPDVFLALSNKAESV